MIYSNNKMNFKPQTIIVPGGSPFQRGDRLTSEVDLRTEKNIYIEINYNGRRPIT